MHSKTVKKKIEHDHRIQELWAKPKNPLIHRGAEVDTEGIRNLFNESISDIF